MIQTNFVANQVEFNEIFEIFNLGLAVTCCRGRDRSQDEIYCYFSIISKTTINSKLQI